MTERRQQVGRAGEKAARVYLENVGYRIIETNYTCPLGEIDIIAGDGNSTVIVEVRTRTGNTFGTPEESITNQKAYRLRRLALYYLQSKNLLDRPGRIDLVAVKLDSKDLAVQSVNHLKNILPE